MSHMMIGLVTGQGVDAAWPQIRRWIEDAFSYSVHHEMTADELRIDIVKGKYLLLIAGDPLATPERRLRGVSVVGIAQCEGSAPIVNMMASGGIGMDEWFGPMFEVVKRIAVDAGASRICAMGRPGWSRTMRRHGIAQAASVYVHRVSDRDRLEHGQTQGSA